MTLPDSEVPGILVALPGLKDSYFEKTVILLFNYNEEGAMGLVMNHTSGSQVWEILKEDTPEESPLNIPLLLGGPVQPEMFWAVHGPDYEGESTTTISSGIVSVRPKSRSTTWQPKDYRKYATWVADILDGGRCSWMVKSSVSPGGSVLSMKNY